MITSEFDVWATCIIAAFFIISAIFGISDWRNAQKKHKENDESDYSCNAIIRSIDVPEEMKVRLIDGDIQFPSAEGKKDSDYMLIVDTAEWVYREPDYYNKNGYLDEAQMEEDDVILIRFVADIIRGHINSEQEKREFFRDEILNRETPTNGALLKRAEKYLLSRHIEFSN